MQLISGQLCKQLGPVRGSPTLNWHNKSYIYIEYTCMRSPLHRNENICKGKLLLHGNCYALSRSPCETFWERTCKRLKTQSQQIESMQQELANCRNKKEQLFILQHFRAHSPPHSSNCPKLALKFSQRQNTYTYVCLSTHFARGDSEAFSLKQTKRAFKPLVDALTKRGL